MKQLRITPLWVLAMLALAVMMSAARGQSLFDESKYRALAADRKALSVGDIVTVQVYEQSSATTSTDTTTERTNAVNVSISPNLSGANHGLTASQGGSFDGGGTTQRANKLLVTLSVSVKEVLANGDLLVAGEQLLTVNKEQHRVSIVGRVRPQDISGDNQVLSTHLADARIEYVGEGDLSERQKRAWWRQAMDFLGF